MPAPGAERAAEAAGRVAEAARGAAGSVGARGANPGRGARAETAFAEDAPQASGPAGNPAASAGPTSPAATLAPPAVASPASSTSLSGTPPGTVPATGPGGPAPASGAGATWATAAPAESPAFGPAAFAVTQDIHTAAFPTAMGVQLSVLARNGIEQARILVTPEQMGPIAVQLALDGTQLRVDFVAENGQTRQLLQDGLPALAGSLREAGFTLAGGGVFQQARDGRSQPEGPGADGFAGRNTLLGPAALGPAEGDLGLQAARARRVRASGLVDTFA